MATIPVTELTAEQINNPSLPPGTQQVPIVQNVQPGELLNTSGLAGNVSVPSPIVPGSTQIPIPTQTPSATYDANLIGNVPQGIAEQGTVSAQGQVGDITGVMDPNATVQEQYRQLTDFAPGAIPGWAKGAVEQARAEMLARGISSSTMAGEATTEAVLKSALPIAQQDAQTYANLMMSNLNFRQQAAFQNATAFLQMDMANLGNRQQTSLANLQIRYNTLLSNQAADNAAKQFNATSEQQNNQFFANLISQIKEQNAARSDAMAQFTSQLTSTTDQFNAQMKNARETFNVQNQQLIDQSNATWRRMVNTSNTAAQNAANEANVQNLYNMSQTAQSALWQQFRDEASWANSASENSLNRAHNLAIAALERQTAFDINNEQQKQQLYELMGSFALNLIA